MRRLIILCPLITLIGALPAIAHHNPGYYFDMREVVIHTDATVVSYTAVNPHGRIVYSMADENGTMKEWVAELPANNMMRRYGVNGEIVKAGDKVSLRGNPGRSGATMLRVTHLLLPSGDVTTFYAPQGTGSPEDLEAN